MMISPNCFVDKLKDKTYKELLKERDKLIRQIRAFEKDKVPEIEYSICPSPEVVYQMNLQYLGELCNLIAEKYNKEYVWKDWNIE